MTSMMGNMGATHGNSLKGTGYKSFQMPNFTPEMMQLFQQSMANVGPNSFMGRLAGGDQSMFDQMESPALQQFAGLQGNMASRFSGMGSGQRGLGQGKGSSFQNNMNTASSDFAQQLQANRLGLQQNAWQQLMGMSNQLLQQKPFENLAIAKQRPWWQDFLTSIMGGVGKGIGGLPGMFGQMFPGQQQQQQQQPFQPF